MDEAVEVARVLEAEGADALVLSGGFMTRTPMFVMHGDVPHRELRRELSGFGRKLAAFLLSRFTVRSVPFREAYFLGDAVRVREAVKLPLVLVGGLRKLRVMADVIAQGFDFLALARPLIREPDLVMKFESGSSAEALCIPCNKCLASVAKGAIRCPERPYPASPAAAKV